MERVLITGIQMFADVTEVKWERRGGEPDVLMVSGSWLISDGVVIAGVLEYAKKHVDAGIEVKVKLEKR